MFFTLGKTTWNPSVSPGNPTDNKNMRGGHQQWNTRPFVILFPSCDWSVNSMRSFTLLAIRSLRWIEPVLGGGRLCRWSQIVVCISSLTQSPPITYTWPLRSKRHTLDKRQSKAQLDTSVKVTTLLCFIILLLFSLKFFYYCPSVQIRFYEIVFPLDCIYLAGSWNCERKKITVFSLLYPDVWLWCCSTVGA